MKKQDIKTIMSQKKSGKPILGCFPLYPPVELFSSMDLFPIVLWHLKGSISTLLESDLHIQDYACGISRELVQFLLSDYGKMVDGIFSYNACDTLRNLPEILKRANCKRNHDIPMLRIHVPQVNRMHSNPNVYLADEIIQLIQDIENAFSVKFSSERFFQTTKYFAKMRELCKVAEKLVAEGQLSFCAFCEVILSGNFLPIEMKIDRLSSLISRQKTSVLSEKKIIISGIMPPPAPVLQAIEQSGMRVVANDIACLKRSYAYSPEPSDHPTTYYIDYFMNRFPCSTLLYQTDSRTNHLIQMIEQSDAIGVIFSGEKFCEYEYFEFPYFEKRMKDMGVRTMLLEFAVDDEIHLDAHVTRVEAFSEMLDQCK
jgi:benzoyl-CoA reductase/2-hydroxyglutaryl-CoA dehydratase subunit BcrC/BadD/HgdB